MNTETEAPRPRGIVRRIGSVLLIGVLAVVAVFVGLYLYGRTAAPQQGPCVREERSTDIGRCKSPIRNWGRAEAGILHARRPRKSGRTVPAGRRRARSASAFAHLQSIARDNRRM